MGREDKRNMSLQNIINIVVSVIYIITIMSLWFTNKRLYNDNVQFKKVVKAQLKMILHFDHHETMTKDEYYKIVNNEFRFVERKNE